MNQITYHCDVAKADTLTVDAATSTRKVYIEINSTASADVGLTPNKARALADNLYAAADYAERPDV